MFQLYVCRIAKLFLTSESLLRRNWADMIWHTEPKVSVPICQISQLTCAVHLAPLPGGSCEENEGNGVVCWWKSRPTCRLPVSDPRLRREGFCYSSAVRCSLQLRGPWMWAIAPSPPAGASELLPRALPPGHHQTCRGGVVHTNRRICESPVHTEDSFDKC